MSLIRELRIIKDHWYFRTVKRTRPWAIHTECIHKDNVWKAVQKYVKSGRKDIWYVVTPENFDFVKTEAGVDISQNEWKKKILKRYKWLKDNGQEVQLHVHLRIKMNLYTGEEMKKDVDKKVAGGLRWLKKNGFDPTSIVFGWWSYNNYAISVAKKHGLHISQRLDNYFIHDYDVIGLV